MVTIKMIAKECGFSIATVSKALNGAPDISAETKETIRKVASQMGYTPNSAARMLKTSRSYNFGVLFEDQANKGLTHSFFSHILNSFKHRAEELGYDISFISDHMGGQEISYVDHARYRNCDGVVIASVDYTEHAVVDLANSDIICRNCSIAEVRVGHCIITNDSNLPLGVFHRCACSSLRITYHNSIIALFNSHIHKLSALSLITILLPNS